MKHRSEIEEEILTFAKRMTPGGGSHLVYKALFKKMNDEQFKAFWNGICDSNFIPVFVNNFDNKEMIDYDDVCLFAKKKMRMMRRSVSYKKNNIKKKSPTNGDLYNKYVRLTFLLIN